MSARAALRAGTAAEHERVDRLFSGLNFGRADDYRRFLLAQAAAYLPIEAALDAAGAEALLDDWSSRRRAPLLFADLGEMGLAAPAPSAAPSFVNPAQMLGAIYVLEGSRLGGALLKRGIGEGLPRRFLDAPQKPGSWRKLLDNMERFLYRSDQLEAAVGAAKSVFQGFEAGGLRYLESGRT